MEIPLFDSGDRVPQPKENVRIESLTATPYPDRFRVFIEIKVTPFQERPNLILVMHSSEGKVIGELNIIETMHFDMEFTMHIRGLEDPAGSYSLDAELFYEERNPPHDQQQVHFDIPTTDQTPE